MTFEKQFRIVVLARFHKLAKKPDKEIIFPETYSLRDKAEKRALKYLKYCPDDIVMLTEEHV